MVKVVVTDALLYCRIEVNSYFSARNKLGIDLAAALICAALRDVTHRGSDARFASQLESRFGHLCDSQVVIAVLVEERFSSRQSQRCQSSSFSHAFASRSKTPGGQAVSLDPSHSSASMSPAKQASAVQGRSARANERRRLWRLSDLFTTPRSAARCENALSRFFV